VLWHRNDLLRFRLRLWKSFGPGSGSRQYLAQFADNKKFVQNLAFSMSESALFPKKLASIFLALFLHYPNPVPEPDPELEPEP
jgi:hypothetical protein